MAAKKSNTGASKRAAKREAGDDRRWLKVNAEAKRLYAKNPSDTYAEGLLQQHTVRMDAATKRARKTHGQEMRPFKKSERADFKMTNKPGGKGPTRRAK